MLDRFLSASLGLLVTLVITVASMTCLILGYWGLVQALNGSVKTGSIAVLISVVAAVIAFQSACHRNDLVDQ